MNTIRCPGSRDALCGEELETQTLLVEHLVVDHGHEQRYAEGLALRAATVCDQVREIVALLRRNG